MVLLRHPVGRRNGPLFRRGMRGDPFCSWRLTFRDERADGAGWAETDKENGRGCEETGCVGAVYGLGGKPVDSIVV